MDKKLLSALNKFRNLTAVMTRDILVEHRKPTSMHGFKRIPSISDMKLMLSPYNELLERVGLKRRLPIKLKFKLTSSDKMNRYIKYQLSRAERIRSSNPRLFWRIAIFCIKRSVAFRTSSYNRVFPQWWHEESLGQVWNKLRRISRILNEDREDLEYRRVYIPKKDTFRPLGVPTGEWRVVMHMYNNWLTMYLRPTLDRINHAYIPGRGTLTAWKELILKGLKARNIYEYDLKQFFPNVDVETVSNKLIEKGVPKSLVYFLENINRTTPSLPKERKLDETQTEDKNLVHEGILSGTQNLSTSIYEQVREIGLPTIYEMMKEDGETNIQEWFQMQWAAFDSFGLQGAGTIFKGLPQGLNTSPTLSILTLEDWIKSYKKRRVYSTNFADDGLLYSSRTFQPFSQAGAELNKEKSKWLKRDGKWLVPTVKFLGIEYVTKTGMIRGKTRNGSTLEFDSKRSELFTLLKQLKPDYDYRDIDHLALSGVMGLVMSKLYIGDWKEVPENSKPWKINVKSWWNRKVDAKGHPTMSTTACVYLANIIRLTM